MNEKQSLFSRLLVASLFFGLFAIFTHRAIIAENECSTGACKSSDPIDREMDDVIDNEEMNEAEEGSEAEEASESEEEEEEELKNKKEHEESESEEEEEHEEHEEHEEKE
jgi:hypothetical protein